MKKRLLTLFAMTAGLFIASCSSDELEKIGPGNEAQVTFALNVENGVQTKAISDGSGADKLVYAVFDESGNALPVFGANQTQKVETNLTDLKTGHKVTINLAKGQTYQVAFWAQDADCQAYNTNDLKNVTVNYAQANNNDETRDAFFKTVEVTVSGDQTMDVVLKRPFAQLNVGVTKADWDAAVASGLTITQSYVTLEKVANQINLLDGTVSGEVNLTYDFAQIPQEDLTVKNAAGKDVTYKYLSMSYLLPSEKTTGAEKTTLDKIKFIFKDDANNQVVFDKGLTNVPVQRNWRTNILGQILTGTIDFTITLDPAYAGDLNYPEYTQIADGVSLDKENKTYTLSNKNGLIWFANQTNGITTKAGENSYEINGYTFKLTADVDLKDVTWTPIGTTKAFIGTFDGGNNTISNLTVTGTDVAGLFGTAQGTVKNVRLSNVAVQGNFKAAALVADGLCSQIENCHVEGGKVVSTPRLVNGKMDDGNNVGGITGYLSAEPTAYVKNCSVKNLTVIAYRDLGGVVGKANGACVISGNSVDNVEVICNQDVENYVEGKEALYGEIVGRNMGNAVIESNQTNNVKTQLIEKSTDNVIEVADAAKLRSIASLITEGRTSFAGKTIKLTADIDLRGEEWTPMNTWDDMMRNATIDGENHSITSMTIRGTSNLGFIGKNSSDITIKNLTFIDPQIEGIGSFIGTVIGYQYGAVKLENVKVQGGSIRTSIENKGIRIGGIVGFSAPDNKSLSMTNCAVSGVALEGYHNVGGLVGSTMHTGQVTMTNCTVTNNTFTYGGTDTRSWNAFDCNGYSEGVGEKTDCTAENNTAISRNIALNAATGNYEIQTKEGLLQFAKNVNDNNNSYAGKKVVLIADIDLAGVEWQPIGNVNDYPSKTFAGTFDGQNHMISNLKADNKDVNYAASGLFGSITGKVHNLRLKDVTITSLHYAGAICGYSSANGSEIKNCHVEGGTITSTPEKLSTGKYDNGDKAGGIIGYCVTGDVVDNCSVKGLTIRAYRDLGGIAGCAAGTITNNTVENVTIIQDKTNGYKTEAITTFKEIIGRDEGATKSGNTAANVTLEKK